MKKFLSLILLFAVIAAVGAAGAQAEWISLGTATVEEMFTERDFDPAYDSFEEIFLADGASKSDSSAVRIDGDTIQISQEGVYKLSGSLSNGQIIIYAPEKAKVQLVLDNVSITNQGGAAIYAINGDKVFITAEKGSVNSLVSVGELADEDIDGAVYAKTDICFNGEGQVSIESESGHGIATKDDLKICSGSYSIKAAKHGLSGKDSIRIGGGSIEISSGSDGLHSDHDDEDKGYIFIIGGTLDISSAKDGIDCTNYFTMLDGAVSINAESDGINAAAEDDFDGSCFVAVSGGVLNITAKEDGIDSNGSLGVSGGEVYISAAPNGGDGALDYGTAAEVSGGVVVAASGRDMAANFLSADAQGSMLCVFSQPHSAGENITLSLDGKELLSFAPMLDYQAVVISSPDVVEGNTYTVSAGDETVEITMSGKISSNGFSPKGGFGMSPPGAMPPEGFPQMEDMPQDFAPGGKAGWRRGEFSDAPDGAPMKPEG